MSNQEVGLVIIGSGLAECTAAVPSARAGLAPVVIVGSVIAGCGRMEESPAGQTP